MEADNSVSESNESVVNERSKFKKKFKSAAISLDDFNISRPDSPIRYRAKPGKSLYAGSHASSGPKVHINSLEWEDRQDIFILKYILRNFKDASSFGTNILKMCLNRMEEHLACILVSHYQVNIDDLIIERAVDANMLNFLKNVFAYSKNFHYSTYKNYTFNYLINKISETNEDVLNKVESVGKWEIRSTENVLKILLEKGWDKLAIKYSEFYIKDANLDLLKCCIRNENEEFLKYAFNNYVFLHTVINSQETINIILEFFK